MSEPTGKKPQRRPGRPRTAGLIPTRGVGQTARLWVEEEGEKVRRTVRLGTGSKVVANARRRRILAGESPGRVSDASESFRDAAERIVGASTIATKGARLSRLRRFAYPIFGDRPVGAITVVDVKDAMAEMVATRVGQKLTQSVVHLKNDISAVLGELYSDGLIAENAAARVSFRKKDNTLGGKKVERVKKRPLVLSDPEFTALIARGLERQRAAGAECLGEIYMLSLASRTIGGGRGSDLHAWRYEHIDLEGWQDCFMPRPKTDKVEDESARHAIPPEVAPFLVAWWAAHGRPTTGPVFPVRKGPRAGQHRLEMSHAQELRDAVWEAGITRPLPGFHQATSDEARRALCALQVGQSTPPRGPLDFHSWRRAYSSATRKAPGVTLWQAMEYTDHKDAPTYQRYHEAERVLPVPTGAIPVLPPMLPPMSPPVPGGPESSARAIVAAALPLLPPLATRKRNDYERARSDSNARPLASENPDDVIPQPFSSGLVNPGHLQKHEETPCDTERRQNSPPVFEAVDDAVQAAISAAMARGEWDTVAALVEVARKRAGGAPDNVERLDDARAKRRK